MTSYLSVGEFFRRYPDDAACLDDLKHRRFGARPLCPRCARTGGFGRLARRRAYACQWCGYLLRPTAGTPFAATRAPLQLWFYALYWTAQNRRVPPVRALQRGLGVSYATAWRMAGAIRSHLPDAARSGGGFLAVYEF